MAVIAAGSQGSVSADQDKFEGRRREDLMYVPGKGGGTTPLQREATPAQRPAGMYRITGSEGSVPFNDLGPQESGCVTLHLMYVTADQPDQVDPHGRVWPQRCMAPAILLV
jgi:hypothetical protein